MVLSKCFLLEFEKEKKGGKGKKVERGEKGGKLSERV